MSYTNDPRESPLYDHSQDDDYRLIQRALDQAELDEREILADLPPEEDGDEELVRAVLGPVIARATAGASGHSPNRLLSLHTLAPIAAVVLAGVALYAWFMGVSTSDDVREMTLGGDDAGLSPSGDDFGPTYPAFHWEVDCPPAGSFRVEVLSLDGEELLKSPDLSDHEWSIPAEDERGLPPTIQWRLYVHNANGDVIGSYSTLASRSPRSSGR